MKKHRRDPHTRKADLNNLREQMEQSAPEKAKERFRRPAYQTRHQEGNVHAERKTNQRKKIWDKQA